METLKNTMIALFLIVVVLSGTTVRGQLDDRFGAVGAEATKYLGPNGLNWYRDWQDSYLPGNFPPQSKNKIWTVGKIDYRTDGLGMDYKWIILDLLEDTDVDFLQNFLNLCLAVVDSNILPIIGDYWKITRPSLETQLEDTLNHFTYTDKKYGIKYRAKCKNTDISFQESLPEFVLTVKQDTILLNTSFAAIWKTHIYIEAWVLNPNPFHWGYFWKDIGDADCEFQTTIYLSGNIGLDGQGRERRLQIKKIVPDSKTESDIDWSVFGIDFTWEELSNSIEDLVDDELESALKKELNKSPITDPYYLVDFFKPLFSKGIVPTQQEILDRIWESEKSHIENVIRREGYEGGYWSIGYEPNWFLMLKPDQYAEFYTKYYRLIKNLDPAAKVMGPSLFLTEAIGNPGEIAWLFIPEIFQGFLAAIKDDFKKVIESYFEMADSKTWYSEFISHLPSDVKVDVNDFHIFPMSTDFRTMDWDSITSLMDEMAGFMRKVSQADEVWVSEFGNIDGKRTESDAAELCRKFSRYFKSNTVGITRWFWFLSRGHSPFYDIPFAPKPPQTALLNKNFGLTQIGTTYLSEADNTPPIMQSAPSDAGKYARPGKIIFQWKEAKEYDTGIADYQLQVKSEPGNNPIFNAWVGNKLSYAITCYATKTLYARVQAKNGAGLIGEWSDWSDGITIQNPDSADADIADKSDHGDGDSQDSIAENNHLEKDGDRTNSASASSAIPNSFFVSQNYPNPFNSSTTINYQLPEDFQVSIKIYNSVGQEIRTLADEYHSAGYYSLSWNGRDQADNPVVSGIYLCRIRAGNYDQIQKMVVVR